MYNVRYSIFMDTNPDMYKWAPSGVVSGADHLIKLKNTKGLWDVVDEVIKVFEKTDPKRYDSFILNIKDTKANAKIMNLTDGRVVTNTSKDKETGGTLRHKADIPVKVIYMLRKLYPDLDMGKEFLEEWIKRYPGMKISEVI